MPSSYSSLPFRVLLSLARSAGLSFNFQSLPRRKAAILEYIDQYASPSVKEELSMKAAEYVHGKSNAQNVPDSSLHEFVNLPYSDIHSFARSHGVRLQRADLTTKDALVSAIVRHASGTVIEQLDALARERMVPDNRRRKRSLPLESSSYSSIKRPRYDLYRPAKSRQHYQYNDFLKLPNRDTILACYRDFYAATSNNAVKQVVCAVCAREVTACEELADTLDIAAIPNRHRLRPDIILWAHTLFDGALLEPAGVTRRLERWFANICTGCLKALKASEPDLPPPLSLANNMWIGPIPDVLLALTFTEQLLISHLYPRVFTFKLYPKRGSRQSETLQRGMRGTVSTFEFDMAGITRMLEGNAMPRPMHVLPSLLSITYIGVGKVPEKWLYKFFRVRRKAVFDALVWLRHNNPKYYKDIVLDESRLSQLPDDAVPDEVRGIVRQLNDVSVLEQEDDTYVPDLEGNDGELDDEYESSASRIPEPEAGYTSDDGENDPDVVPLSVNGSIDMNLSSLTTQDLISWGLCQLQDEGRPECSYGVQHSRAAVRDFNRLSSTKSQSEGDDNLFEKAYPCLFPYGVGGIESRRPVRVSFEQHVRWALQYHDRRFRVHETFMFLAFGILQKREALLSARLEMNTSQFEKDAPLLATITVDKLKRAADEEARHQPISDPAVLALRKHIFAAISRIKGSNESRICSRSRIWSTIIMCNPAVIWLTINFADIHDPIAQVFAGHPVDLDNFVPLHGPSRTERARTIATDPYAAAKFFHFLIRTILEVIFGVRVTEQQIRNREGIFGRVSGYFGSVESQGRGSLHLHSLLFLEDAPPGDRIMEMLQTEDFRERVKVFIRENLRSYLPGLESAESVKLIPKETDIAFNRPPHPDLPHYEECLSEFELRVARASQIHSCRRKGCLVFRNGQWRCKRRAPFDLSPEDGIDATGHWHSKRLYEYVSGWIPGVLINARCNNDGKLLTNADDTKNVTAYVTLYAAKKQGLQYNSSAVLAKGYAYHLDQFRNTTNVEEIRSQHKNLLFRMVNSLNRQQELSAPLVVSYLMGWGDTYESHRFVPLYWPSFYRFMLKTLPELTQQTSPRSSTLDSNPNDVLSHLNTSSPDRRDTVRLSMSSGEGIITRNQITDYQLRGEALADYNVVEFVKDTYESGIVVQKQSSDSSLLSGTSTRGRPRSERVRYLEGHPKAAIFERVIRSSGHNTLPNFIVAKFPKEGEEGNQDLFYASMLLLLKPWRILETDLKSPTETWHEAFHRFFEGCSTERKLVLAGIRYLQSCQVALENREDTEPDEHTAHRRKGSGSQLDSDECISIANSMSTDTLEYLLSTRVSLVEKVYSQVAIECGRFVGMFPAEDDESQWPVNPVETMKVANASGGDIQRVLQWQQEMSSLIHNPSNIDVPPGFSDGPSIDSDPSINVSSSVNAPGIEVLGQDMSTEQDSLDLSCLNADQRRAYDIIIGQLDAILAGRNPPPLRLIVEGEGGTGKSKVLQMVTAAFEKRGQSHRLLKCAYTGVAASLVGGKTIHTAGGINIHSPQGDMSPETKEKMEALWALKDFLAIDEMGTIAKDLLAIFSRNVSIAKHCTDGSSFGGVNVILFGDFHQFGPVARSVRQCLYCKTHEDDTLSTKIGRAIYEEFDSVVQLKEQKRVVDLEWLDFLRHLRSGNVQPHHVAMLRSLVLGAESDLSSTKYDEPPWSNATLVTPRHVVREEWNHMAIEQHCRRTGRQVFICPALDTVGGRPLSERETYQLELHRHSHRRTSAKFSARDAPLKIEIAIGMQVMVTENVDVEFDVANGSRGEVVDIILHPDEPPIDYHSPEVKLRYPPVCILVKLSYSRGQTLSGLESGVLPIWPLENSYRVKFVDVDNGHQHIRVVRRLQLPLTPGYAFTDYRAQGQTLSYVIVDIATPPSGGGLNLFNLYVALSRSSGRGTIRILRDFDDSVFYKCHDEALIAEDERLAFLDRMTMQKYAEH